MSSCGVYHPQPLIVSVVPFQHLGFHGKQETVGCFGQITSLPKLYHLLPSLLTTKAHPIDYWRWKELRNHLVQPPHLINKKTEVQGNEETYSTLPDKSEAKPGPEPSNMSPPCVPPPEVSICVRLQPRKENQCYGEMVMNFMKSSNFPQLSASWEAA